MSERRFAPSTRFGPGAVLSTHATDDWVARSLRAVWHPCTQMKHHERLPLIPVARGERAWLFDRAGNRYLDAISSWWVNLFGHANPRINAALKQQLDTLEHAMLAGCTHESAIELAERLAARTQHTLGHAFFASDGASAVEIALKMSFHAWRNRGRGDKREFVCIANGYHGETIGALGVTDVALFKDAYDPLIRAAHVVASPDARGARDGETAADVAARALGDVRRLFAERGEKIAALIVEPLVQCAAGFAMHDPSYVRGLRALCDAHDVHLIADEIAVGCGRTGTFFACEQAHVWPDFLCLSKGISGGYLPLSLVLSRDAIFDAFYDDDVTRGFLHSHSYTGNPLACRAAVATLELFDTDDVLAENARKSALMREALAPLASHPHVRHLRERGTIFAFDVALEGDAARTFPRRFFEHALARETLLRPIGTTVYLMPPYILDEGEIEWLASRTRATLDATLSEAHA
ncbi:adenosylmethionine-8-amino-7-oxononanoate aminotransferase [Burkholderia pseudomallei]|nr:adenosylmethionine-8-amino-7-oxononanoate transaminase [Burkholderia pseudomallei MSHR4377]CAJ2762990.1 adenosylmethionine-8-amino-7-oxononanoate aminotransferase [Burkholderia pseudomallei]CAJ2787485.1 adenosylmethionine-8-amino-7-oxononanoate aminotransferase [Burkholderia pseudomallei]CAJ2791472.1 adenosylmethionine-8-amino-7-oxononanoate aminotransferase [Burkholderia pseudomallei]CAJ2853586.1 adenosylmethionine-8-amino-7-oxononanoate aminotransferase [Burkholderia pseudomallei]